MGTMGELWGSYRESCRCHFEKLPYDAVAGLDLLPARMTRKMETTAAYDGVHRVLGLLNPNQPGCYPDISGDGDKESLGFRLLARACFQQAWVGGF